MYRIATGIIAAVLGLSAAGCGSLENKETAFSVPEENKTVQQSITPSLEESRESSSETVDMEEKSMKISVKSSEYEIIYELNESEAAYDLLEQLPLTVETEPFSNNEITFYPLDELNTENTPLSSGEAGTLAYYASWGDVVMFYAPCSPNNSLFELGRAVSGGENVENLTGTVTVSIFEE